MCADATKCAHFLAGKGFYDWKHAVERLRRHEQSMGHINATIAFSPRCKSLGRIDNELACQVNQCETILEIASARNVWFLSYNSLLSED